MRMREWIYLRYFYLPSRETANKYCIVDEFYEHMKLMSHVSEVFSDVMV